MKARIDAILQREQAEYLDRLLLPSDELLAEMEEHAAQHRVPIADREVALLLEITARAIFRREQPVTTSGRSTSAACLRSRMILMDGNHVGDW